MNQLTLTEWYPATTLPVRKGVYEVEWEDRFNSEFTDIYFNYWNGEGFSSGFSKLNSWETGPKISTETYKDQQHRVIRWRGVAR